MGMTGETCQGWRNKGGSADRKQTGLRIPRGFFRTTTSSCPSPGTENVEFPLSVQKCDGEAPRSFACPLWFRIDPETRSEFRMFRGEGQSGFLRSGDLFPPPNPDQQIRLGGHRVRVVSPSTSASGNPFPAFRKIILPASRSRSPRTIRLRSAEEPRPGTGTRPPKDRDRRSGP